MPVTSLFVAESPYHIQNRGEQVFLFKAEKEILPPGLITRPEFYGFSTEEGIPYASIALLHGKDCLASSVIQTCVYWNSGQRCRFCGIELSLRANHTILQKTPAQLAEASAAAQTHDLIKHVVLTTGTGAPPGSEIAALAECSSAIKKKTGLPIHAQFQPPSDLEILLLL